MRKAGLLIILTLVILLTAQAQSLDCDLAPLGDVIFGLDESDMRGKSKARQRRLQFFTYEMGRAELAALDGDFDNTLHAVDQIGRRSIRRKGWLRPEAADAVNSALFELRSCLTTPSDEEPVDDPGAPTDPTPPGTPTPPITPPPPVAPPTNTPPGQVPTPPGPPGNPPAPPPPMPPTLPTAPEPQG